MKELHNIQVWLKMRGVVILQCGMKLERIQLVNGSELFFKFI